MLDEARGAMRGSTTRMSRIPSVSSSPSRRIWTKGRRRFVEEARNDHAHRARSRAACESADSGAGGRAVEEAAASLSRAEELLAEMLSDGLGYENDARFLILAAQIDLAQAQDSIGNPAERRNTAPDHR